MVIENPNPIPLEYPTLLEVLKKELAQDPKKSLVSFCEKHSINYDHFNRWLRTTGRSFTRLCNEVRLKTGLPQNSNELYLNSLGLLKNELDNDINRKRLLNYILYIRFFSGMHSIVSASQFSYTNLSQGCY